VEHQNRKGLPKGIANRVILQGKYGESFIEYSQNEEKPFFLYLSLYGPHIPLIKKSDPYYKNFPELDYPHYDDWRDDRRRMGLALIKSIDDAVGGVMAKLREHGLEENTMILFASDNGAPSKMGRDEPGLPGGGAGNKGRSLEWFEQRSHAWRKRQPVRGRYPGADVRLLERQDPPRHSG